MSRIGKKPIVVPQGVEVSFDAKNVTVSGAKGKLSIGLHPHVRLEKGEQGIVVSVENPQDHKDAALWGLFRSLVANMVKGITEGFSRGLEISGIGFKAEVKKDVLVLHLGYSHPVEYKISEGISVKVEKNIITVSGIDKQLVGQTAAEIRSLKKPEPYKGKGIHYVGEVLRKKAGKAATKTE